MRILLAFPKRKEDLAGEIRKKLEEKLFEGNPPQQGLVAVDWARNETDALSLFNENSYSLVLCTLHLPADSTAPLREEEQRGLSLLASLKRMRPGTPVVFVVTRPDNRVYNLLNEYTDCRSIQEGQELENNLMELCRIAICQATISRPTCRVDIDINIDSKQPTSIGKYVIENKDLGLRQSDYFFLDSRIMNRILRASERLEEDISKNTVSASDWQRDFKCLGEDLTNEFIGRNSLFLLKLQKAVMKVGSFENIRIRFILNKVCYSIVLEALMDEEQQLMMLLAPMYRQLNVDRTGGSQPLEDFRPGSPINCLIIEADTQGFVRGLKRGDVDLQRLPGLRNETSWLEGWIKAKTTGEVKVISRRTTPRGKTFLQYMSEVLCNHKWDLVHFTGHSLCDTDDTGYLILPGSRGVEKLKISEFANFLRMAGTYLVYLDSCESSASAMVFMLVEQQIPAIMGFRWPVQQDMATLYAKRFYQHLFEMRSLEEAFFHARREIHNECLKCMPENASQSSAALLLILQTP